MEDKFGVFKPVDQNFSDVYQSFVEIRGEVSYHIYRRNESDLEAVKDGWSWPGFLFTTLWLLVKRLWLYAILVFLITILFNEITFSIYSIEINKLAPLVINILIGQYGNSLCINRLKKLGYTFSGSVLAKTPEEAIQNLFAEKEPKEEQKNEG